MFPPLQFEPVFKTALWGGRRIADVFPTAPSTGPVSEAWVLSDHVAGQTAVANGAFAGMTLRGLLRDHRSEMLGDSAENTSEFPLLLKFLDARETLSVQVHPDDHLARTRFEQPRGKTEAWVVLAAEPGSRIYAGLRPGVSRGDFEAALRAGRCAECLHSFEPKTGDCVFLPAGTVHALGGGLVVFEVQQSSDTTFRLDDWGRVDARTGQPRELHVADGLQCIDFDMGPRQPNWSKLVAAEPLRVEMLVESQYFQLRRYSGERSFAVATAGRCRVLVALDGTVIVRWRDVSYTLTRGQTLLLPATAGECECRPYGPFALLECTPMSVPDVC